MCISCKIGCVIFVVTVLQVKALTLQQVVNIWRIYVKQLVRCLNEIGDDTPGDQQALADAQRLAGEACDLQMRVALCNPFMFKEFVASKMEDSAGPDAENRELWLEVNLPTLSSRSLSRPPSLCLWSRPVSLPPTSLCQSASLCLKTREAEEMQ